MCFRARQRLYDVTSTSQLAVVTLRVICRHFGYSIILDCITLPETLQITPDRKIVIDFLDLFYRVWTQRDDPRLLF